MPRRQIFWTSLETYIWLSLSKSVLNSYTLFLKEFFLLNFFLVKLTFTNKFWDTGGGRWVVETNIIPQLGPKLNYVQYNNLRGILRLRFWRCSPKSHFDIVFSYVKVTNFPQIFWGWKLKILGISLRLAWKILIIVRKKRD